MTDEFSIAILAIDIPAPRPAPEASATIFENRTTTLYPQGYHEFIRAPMAQDGEVRCGGNRTVLPNSFHSSHMSTEPVRRSGRPFKGAGS